MVGVGAAVAPQQLALLVAHTALVIVAWVRRDHRRVRHTNLTRQHCTNTRHIRIVGTSKARRARIAAGGRDSAGDTPACRNRNRAARRRLGTQSSRVAGPRRRALLCLRISNKPMLCVTRMRVPRSRNVYSCITRLTGGRWSRAAGNRAGGLLRRLRWVRLTQTNWAPRRWTASSSAQCPPRLQCARTDATASGLSPGSSPRRCCRSPSGCAGTVHRWTRIPRETVAWR